MTLKNLNISGWMAKILNLKYDCRNLCRQKRLMFCYITLTRISDKTNTKVFDNRKNLFNILCAYQILSINSVLQRCRYINCPSAISVEENDRKEISPESPTTIHLTNQLSEWNLHKTQNVTENIIS